MISFGLLIALFTSSLIGTIFLLSIVLIGAYSAKGPFWALASSWMSPTTTAAGLAAIGACANLIGGGMMVNIYGAIHDATGSHAIALLPLAALNLVSAIMVFIMSRKSCFVYTTTKYFINSINKKGLNHEPLLDIKFTILNLITNTLTT